ISRTDSGPMSASFLVLRFTSTMRRCVCQFILGGHRPPASARSRSVGLPITSRVRTAVSRRRAQETLEVTRRDSMKATLTRDDSDEVITTPFEIGRTLRVQPGDYRYGSWQAAVQTSRSRPWAATLSAQRGTFWGGTITTLIEDVTWFKAAGLSLEETYRRDRV